MEIHICDTSLIPTHGCCGGFMWPDEILALCGRMVAFQPVTVDSFDSDHEHFCSDCLHTLRTRSAGLCESVCTVAG